MRTLKESLINKSNIKNASVRSNELYIIFTSSMRAFGDVAKKIKSAVPVVKAVETLYLIVPKDDLSVAKKIITKHTDSYKVYKSKVSDIDELKFLIRTNISTRFYDFCE